MAKTTPTPETPATDEKAVAAMVDKAVEAKMGGLPALIEKMATEVVEKIVEGIVERERGRFKNWARREIELNACGANVAERGEMNR